MVLVQSWPGFMAGLLLWISENKVGNAGYPHAKYRTEKRIHIYVVKMVRAVFP